MDGWKFTNGGAKKQTAAARDFQDDLNRTCGDLAFEMGKVIDIAIDDVTGDDPSACASYSAKQAIKRVVQEPHWAVLQAWRVFLHAFAP